MISSVTFGASSVLTPLIVLKVLVIFFCPSFPSWIVTLSPFFSWSSSLTTSLNGIFSRLSSTRVPAIGFVPRLIFLVTGSLMTVVIVFKT